MEFVYFEIAKKLKEKGFPQHWSDQHYILENEYQDDFFEAGAKYPVEVIYDYIPTIAAPTISQVLKWLREEKEIYISIFVDDDSDCPVTYEIWKDKECVCSHQGEYFTMKEWQKCELRAIEYVINNLI